MEPLLPPPSPSPTSQIDERVLYLQKYKTLLCRQCKLALSPGNGIRRHLMHAHKEWPLKIRKDIAEYASQLELISSNQIVLPTSKGPPIPGLAIPDGWSCDGCSYLCSTERTMQEHSRPKHDRGQATGRRWRQAYI